MSLVYFSLYALREDPEISWINFLLQVIVTIMSLYFMFIEYLQFKHFEEKRHYLSFTNLVDFTSVIVNLVIVLNEAFARQLISAIALPSFVACAVFCLWFRAFYWSRVFESFAFYYILIKKTLTDIIPFMMLCILVIALFANMLYIYNISEHQINPLYETTLYENDSGNGFTNALIHVYLIALGDFDTEGYINRGDFQQKIVWIIFLLATFFIQVTFFNMLIAFMGLIFGEVTAIEESLRMKERLNLI